MKHKITKLFTRLALVAGIAVVFAGTAFANSVTFSYSDYTGQGTSSTGSSYTMTKTDVSITNTKFYGNTSYAQFYAAGTSTVTPGSGVTITGITLTASSQSYNGYQSGGTITPSTGSCSGSGTSVTWTGSASNAFTISNNKQIRWTSIVVTYTKSGGSAATTTTISASGITNTDVYVSTTAGSLSATVKDASNNNISGASVTWSGNNDAVATINASTGAVTLVGAGSVTFTASYAGVTGQYQSSTATYNMTVTDSTPFTGGDVEFDATRESGNSPLSKNGVSFACDNGVLNNGSEYRLYKNSTTTFSVTTGVITSIAFTGVSGKPASGFANQEGWTTSGNNGTWTGSATSVSFVASTDQVRATKIVVTVDLNAVPDPVITAADVNIAYNIASGSIAYEVSNPVSGATLQATIASGATISNMTIGSITTSSVPSTCSANTETTARTATVTLNYVKNNEVLTTKNVTVTQAAAPVIYSTIPALFAAATTTEASVHVTFDSWVVSGVSTNGKNVFVTDNSGNGFVIFDNDGGLGNIYTAGDILSGTDIVCKVKQYNGFAELLELDPSDLTITAGGTVTAANIAMASLAGVNTGALVSYQNLACSIDNNKSYLSDGTTTLQVYNSLYAFGALVAGKHYDITGVYQQFNTTKEILPRSAADIQEVVISVPAITLSTESVSATAAETEGTITITCDNMGQNYALDVVFFEANGTTTTACPDWLEAEINNNNNVDYLIAANNGAARTAYFRVYGIYGNDDDEVYSNLVTVTQAAYVADYAELPFEYDGNGSGTLPAGFTVSGLGTYNSSPKMKFDTTGDYAILKFNERPGKLTFDVKGNPSDGTWAGTFKVQTSVNGSTYTDLASYDNLTTTVQNEEFDNLADNIRYIKWIYSVKTSGNVALGNIKLEEYAAPAPSITVSPATVNKPATPANPNEWNEGTLTITYENLTITDMDDFDVQFYDAENNELSTAPTWIEVEVAEDQVEPGSLPSYVVSYVLDDNDGAARTAYFRVFAMGDEDLVYSNLVTFTQAARVIDYAVLPFAWEGGTKEDFEVLTGVTSNGLGSNYAEQNNPYRIKFDETGDYIQVKTDSQPGIVSIGVKMIGGNSNSTITVQASADGTNFRDIEVLTISGDQNAILTLETTNSFAASDRYVKLLFTKGSNVGIGPITISKYAEPTITLNTHLYNGRYWATFYNGAARYTLPEGAQAFTMNPSRQLYRLGTDGSVIPAGTPVVILVDPETSTANTKSITLTKSTDTDVIAVNGGANYLRGADNPTPITTISHGTPYVLGIVTVDGEAKLGFFPYTGTGDNANIPANKAYYVVIE